MNSSFITLRPGRLVLMNIFERCSFVRSLFFFGCAFARDNVKVDALDTFTPLSSALGAIRASQ